MPLEQLIDALSHAVPKPLSKLITLGRTLKKRAVDVLAYVDRRGPSNGFRPAHTLHSEEPPDVDTNQGDFGPTP